MKAGTMEIREYDNFNEFEKSEWDRLVEQSPTNVPFLRYGYLRNWWQFKGGGQWPENTQLKLLSFIKDDTLTGIAPFFRVGDNETETLHLLGSVEISDYLDFISPANQIDTLVEELFKYLNSEGNLQFKKIVLVNVPGNSPTLPVLEKTAGRFEWKVEIENAYHTPSIKLTDNWEAYLAGIDKKQRHEIRRKIRRLNEDAERLNWYIVSEKELLEDEFEALLEMMALDRQKAKFLTSKMRKQMHALTQWAFIAGYLQLSFLTINGEKASGYICFDYNNRIFVYNSGFDMKFSFYSPGWVHLSYLIQHAIENNKHSFDFMRGDETYKYHFGASDSFVMKAVLTRD